MPIIMSWQTFSIGVGNKRNSHNSSQPITRSTKCFNRSGSQKHSRFGDPILILGPEYCTALHTCTYVIYLQWGFVYQYMLVRGSFSSFKSTHEFMFVCMTLTCPSELEKWTIINHIWSNHPST